MSLIFKIWDKKSPINDCPADKALESMAYLREDDEIYIISDSTTMRDIYVEIQRFAPYPGATIEESAQNHINAILADQAAAEGAAQQPTTEERISALEAAQLAALGV